MSSELYACVHAAEFPAQALLRLRTDLQTEPVAVLDGPTAQETVCSLNRHAVRRGAVLGMTRLEAEGISGLQLLSRSAEVETAAHAVLLECASKFSPRIEEASDGTGCALMLDIAGMELLFGPPEKLAERLRDEMATAGFRVSVATSGNFHAARIKAPATRGIAIIPAGEEARALEKLPIASLALTEEHKETFALWGIRTLGELVALPEVELVKRFGAAASDWRALAHCVARHTFQPIEPEFALKEFYDFETPVEQIDSLLFIGARMIDCLVARAAGRALSLASLTVDMQLEGGQSHHLAIHPAVPSMDRKFLLKLLQLEMGAHPPLAAVVSLTLTAEAGQSSKMQLGLFAPQTPEASRLDVTLARLKAIVGEDRVGHAGTRRHTPPRQLSDGRLCGGCKTCHTKSRMRAHGSAPFAASPSDSDFTGRDEACGLPRWRQSFRDRGCLWSLENQRLLVVSGWMGYGRVGCYGVEREWRSVRLPAGSGPATERVAAGGVL